MTRFPSLLAAAVCTLTVGSTSAVQTTASQNSPKTAAISFYTWFVQHGSDQTYPLSKPDTEHYVATDTVGRLRSDYMHAGPPNGANYFFKVQDYNSHD